MFSRFFIERPIFATVISIIICLAQDFGVFGFKFITVFYFKSHEP